MREMALGCGPRDRNLRRLSHEDGVLEAAPESALDFTEPSST